MEDIKCNLHIHTIYSDGSGDYTQVASEALDAGVDVVIITDHNVLVKGMERYVSKNGKRVLVLTGEEIHDQNRIPQKNHLLVLGCRHEMAQHAYDPQRLIDQVKRDGGLSFLAHPYEFDLPLFNETDISWESWEVEGFTGLELWNGFSELKTVARSLPNVIFHAFFPDLIPHQPLPQVLAKWDQLLAAGKKVVAVSGSDSHALHYRYKFIRKVIFPYRYHFSSINNHLLLPSPLSGDLKKDKQAIYQSLKKGACYICLDRAAEPRGFSFTIENGETKAHMGEDLFLDPGATIRVSLPRKALLRLICNGELLIEEDNQDLLVKTIEKPGAYRVEAYLEHLGEQRGWIFSNPIYVMKKPKSIAVYISDALDKPIAPSFNSTAR